MNTAVPAGYHGSHHQRRRADARLQVGYSRIKGGHRQAEIYAAAPAMASRRCLRSTAAWQPELALTAAASLPPHVLQDCLHHAGLPTCHAHRPSNRCSPRRHSHPTLLRAILEDWAGGRARRPLPQPIRRHLQVGPRFFDRWTQAAIGQLFFTPGLWFDSLNTEAWGSSAQKALTPCPSTAVPSRAASSQLRWSSAASEVRFVCCRRPAGKLGAAFGR